jgi:phosphatidate cytidylyltransferase
MGRAPSVSLGQDVQGGRPASRAAALGKRLLSTLVLLPLFVWLVLGGPVWLFGAVVVLVAARGQWEFTGMFERAGVRTYRLLGLIAGTALTASFMVPGAERVALTAVVIALLVAGLYRPQGAAVAWQPVAVTLLGVCYVNWLLGHGFWLRELEGGAAWVLLLVAVTWIGETGAYVFGSLLGRTKLAPAISPKKTVEGAVAQLVLSIATAVVVHAWFMTALPLGHAIAIGILLGVAGQLGDLAESALKRGVGAKDTAHLIPGHGGMLDRVDGLLFNTPVLFYYAWYGRGLHS